MSHQVLWTETILNNFIQKAMLNDEEIFIMKSRIRGMSVVQQSIELNKSVSTVNNMIKRLKHKYDKVQKEYPEYFPERKFCSSELYMDTH